MKETLLVFSIQHSAGFNIQSNVETLSQRNPGEPSDFFPESYIRKFRDFFPMIFTIRKMILPQKKRFFTKGGPETRESRVRRPGNLE